MQGEEMSKKYKGETCVYCQERPSISQGDHVFSRELFLDPERANLIKVPCCDACNNEKSKYEHYLTSLLPFGGRHEDAKNNLGLLVPPRLDKNLKLKKELKAGMKYAWNEDDDGNTMKNLTVPIDGNRYMELFKYIVKALAWYHWGTFITKDSVIFTTALTKFGEEMFNQHLFSLRSKNAVSEVIGKNTIKYSGVQAVDDNEITVWNFEMYGGIVVSSSLKEGFHKSSSVGAISGPPSVVNPFIELCCK